MGLHTFIGQYRCIGLIRLISLIMLILMFIMAVVRNSANTFVYYGYWV